MTDPTESSVPPTSFWNLPNGAILELAARLWVRATGYMVMAALVIIVPGLVLIGEAVRLVDAHLVGHAGPVVVLLAELVSIEGLFLLVLSLAFSVCVKIAADALFGRVSLMAALRAVLGRLHTILWVLVVTWAVLAIVNLPSVLLPLQDVRARQLVSLLLLVFNCWYFVTTSFSIPSVFFHGERGFAALGRSRRLVRGSWWRCFGLYVLIILLILVTAVLLDEAAGVAVGFSVDDPAATFAFGFLATIAAPLVVFLPLVACVNALLYTDLTARRDHKVDAEELGRILGALPSPDGLVFRLAAGAPPVAAFVPPGPPPVPGPAAPRGWGPPPPWAPDAPPGAPPFGFDPAAAPLPPFEFGQASPDPGP